MSSRTSRLPYLFAGIAVVAVVAVAWANRGRLTPVGPGTAAPAFEAHDLQRNPASLEDFRGDVVLLNVWATWCPPCREEMPSMQRLYESYEGRDFEVVAVSIDAREGKTDDFGRPGGDIQAFADSLGLTFPILHDPSGEIQDIYKMTGVPESFVIGRDGMIYKRVTGATEWDAPDHRELIDRLLASEGPNGSGTGGE